jgi:tetratricopeptide (TPR) repeat protein
MTPIPGRSFFIGRLAFFLALAAVLGPFGTVRANAADDKKDDEATPIKKPDLPKALQEQFDKAKKTVAEGSRSVVDAAWKNLEPKLKDLPDGEYSSKRVGRINEHIAEMIKAEGKRKEWGQRTDVSPQEIKRHQHEEQGKSQKAQMKIAAALGDGAARGAVGGGDYDKTTGPALSKAVDTALATAISKEAASHGPERPGSMTPGDFHGVPIDPSNPDSLQNAARDSLMKGDLSGALANASKAVQMGGGAGALALRGGIELDQKQFSSALKDAQQAIQLDPENKEAQAVAHFADGRVDGVASDGPASAKAGDAGAGGGAGGFASSGSGAGGSAGGAAAERLAGASGSLAISRAAQSGAGLAGMSGEQAQKAAQGAFAMNDFGGAMAFVNRALAKDPKNAAALNLRSRINARQHRYAQAAADAREGLLSAPKDSALLRSLGFAQLRDKDFSGAIATANSMLELNPNDPYAYALRGHAYGSMGDRDAMMSDLKRAAELDPSFREAVAQMGGQLQLPSDKDILFLFPGEDGPMAAKAPKSAAPPAGRSRLFGLLVGASVLGGLLLALGLLHTVLAPLKEQISSAFTRISRSGPTVGAEVENDTAQPASVNGLLPGLIRGQYEVSRQIGQGGMGTVFEGTDRSLGRRVAIKKMRDELRVNPAERARFVIEAKTVAALHHPNIVDIYAIAEEGQDVFLVFEYVDGKTVHELIQSSGRLSIADAARVVRASADALDYAHSRGVIHRDMKPSNVMIDAAGRVKVMDFGIARMAKDSLTRYSLTNTVVGTPPYMAPEQEQGQVRRESDVYALAVCAYEMLTGKLPFIGIGAGMLMNKINMSFVPPSRATAGLPAALDEVFEKAFQAGPDQRYRTPNEFANALEAALPSGVRV